MDVLTFNKLARGYKHINAFAATVQSAHETGNWESYLWLNAFNGTVVDFSPLPDGATLPREAIGCEFIISDVNRINGEIELTILLPHGANASQEARFPEPITMTTDGQVVLPI